MVGMKDTPHKPREAVITDDAKAWVVNLACSKPKEFGYAAEVWTRSALARHVRLYAVQAGYPALAQAAKATVQRILDAQTLRPHKVKYYMERRDPDFLSKMKNVLLVYQEVALQNEAVQNGAPLPIVITVSVDEKPGVQALGNTPGLATGGRQISYGGPRFGVHPLWNLVDSSGSGSSQWACHWSGPGT